MARAGAVAEPAELIKPRDLATYDSNDQTASWQGWKMGTRRMLKDSNIHPRRQPMFVLSALRGGSTDAILASYGQDGPPDNINMETLWTQLDCIFAPVELASDRDKRFAKLKLENFPDIASFIVAYQKAVAECAAQPDEAYRLKVLTTAIQDIPNIAFHMQKAVAGAKWQPKFIRVYH